MSAPTTAIVLAAGLGLRMRPLSATTPKPLLHVGARSLLDRAVDRLRDAGVTRCVVNACWLSEQVVAWGETRTEPDIRVSVEETPLETGGGVKLALERFPDWFTAPFYVVNGDALWLNGYQDALLRLAEQWRGGAMDALLMVHPTVSALGYVGAGDFEMAPDGALSRRADQHVAPFLHTGVQILSPAALAGAPDGAFSLNHVYDRAIKAGRLFGMRHDGAFFHVGAPEDIPAAEAGLADPEFGQPYF